MAIDLAIQGMRRSGTTFLFDVLSADDRFDGYYEPLAAAQRQAVGGGSRIRDLDFFDKIRAARAEFGRGRPDFELDRLNHGAPRCCAAEFGGEFGPEVADYVDFLCRRREWSLLKFVRAAAKLPALLRLRPDLSVVHIVRDPRAVATSFLFGKGRKHADLYRDPDSFFGHDGSGEGPKRLQAVKLADRLIADGQLDLRPDATTVLKLLGLWQWHFRVTHSDGIRVLGAAHYLLLRHEQLLTSPEPALEAIYALIGEQVPESVFHWVRRHLAPEPRVFAPGDARWREAFETLALEAELRLAGYQHLLADHAGQKSAP